MNLLYYCQGDDGRMLQRFRQQLPEHTLYSWPLSGPLDSIEGAIVWLPPDDFFDGLVNLTHVFSIAAGVDHLLNHPGLPARVNIVRLRDAGMAKRMAEYVLYGVLHAHRQFQHLRVAQTKAEWAAHTRTPRAENFPIGIMGAGALGLKVAERLAINGYPVCCWSRTPRKLPQGIANAAGAAALPAFLKQSNVLVCLVPLTDSTRGILNAGLFRQLPKGAFLINPGRGAHLVDNDLLSALDNGQLSGALLDVFHEEPLPAAHRFWLHPRVIITPHLAAPSPIRESVEQISESIACVQRGHTPAGLVNRQRGY